MGVWGARGQPTTSKHKEIYTLLAILRRERRATRLRGRYAFYMTDNTVTYHAVQRGSSKFPHLHRVVREIKLICAELVCVLEVVHIPGKAMIRQGADPISWGLWLAPDQRRLTPRAKVARLFRPAPLTPTLRDWALVRRAAVCPSPLPLAWRIVGWADGAG